MWENLWGDEEVCPNFGLTRDSHGIQQSISVPQHPLPPINTQFRLTLIHLNLIFLYEGLSSKETNGMYG